jgi:hypothetical protein
MSGWPLAGDRVGLLEPPPPGMMSCFDTVLLCSFEIINNGVVYIGGVALGCSIGRLVMTDLHQGFAAH